MISDSHKFICVCNMRVASQSLSKTLNSYCTYDDSHVSALEMKNGTLLSPASNRIVNKSIFNKKTQKWDEYFTFGFVRNPYEHFLSVFLYLKKHGVKNTGSFKEYAKIQKETNYSSMSDWNFTGLFDRISDEDDNIIVDFVGRYENLQEDWKKITDKIGLSGVELVYTNYSNKGGTNLDDYYTEEEREIVRTLYAKDFKMLNYEF